MSTAPELSHARPVLGSMADITDTNIKIRGLRFQGFFATRIVADLTAGTFNSCPGGSHGRKVGLVLLLLPRGIVAPVSFLG
eukprot:scaffold246924_cov16-Tisochrysis_lutea.AAC.1